MTATEVGFLLRAGLPQAADSRTRSLYEQTIVSMILSNDQTYEICERYHDSASIEALRYMRSHNLHAEQLGWEPIRNEELRDAERFAALAVKNWGPEIRTLYGWASPLVPHVRPGKLRFTDLERIVEGEMLRPGYLRLNHSIHAGPSSVIGQTDFQTPHLMITRPTADDGDFGATLSWTLHLLFMTTDLSAHSVTLLTERYDDYLEVGEFVRRAEAVLSLLEGGLLSVQDSTRRG